MQVLEHYALVTSGDELVTSQEDVFDCWVLWKGEVLNHSNVRHGAFLRVRQKFLQVKATQSEVFFSLTRRPLASVNAIKHMVDQGLACFAFAYLPTGFIELCPHHFAIKHVRFCASAFELFEDVSAARDLFAVAGVGFAVHHDHA